MKCPECGTKDAYIGMHNIDCLNPSCKHYQGSPVVVGTLAPPATPPAPAAVSNAPVISNNPPPTPPAMPWGNSAAPAIASPPVTVGILSAKPKLKTVEITFVASGDPGNPTRTVEFYWSVPSQAINKVVCTLSNRSRYFVAGVDADGQTTYTTHWCCTLDGVNPNDPWSLEAIIQ